jgi:hypothetical protein
MTRSLRPPVAVALVWCATAMLSATRMSIAAQPQTRQLEVFVGEADSWDVTSTLIYGKTEAILVGIQAHVTKVSRGKEGERTVRDTRSVADSLGAADLDFQRR